MAVKLSPLAGAGWQFFTDDGIPLAGGKIYTYTAGTTTPQATYTTALGNIAHSNPIILDANGRINEVWMTEGASYKFLITDSDDVTIGTYDNLDGINDVGALVTGIYANLADTTDVAKGDALIGFKQANMAGVYGGAVGQTVHRKLQEVVSVFDFMTTAEIEDVQAQTSLVDVRTAINNAFNALIANGGGTLFFPKGTYYISEYIGNTGSSSNVIDIALVGEPGAIINCNPSAFGNFAVRLIFENLRSAYVSKIWVDCNNKVATGIRIDSTASTVQIAEVDSCRVLNCFGVNNAGVTTSVGGISVSTAGWGFNATIKNCIVSGVRRDKTGLACQAVVATKFQNILIENNSIQNVRHSGQIGDKNDADGIVVFSFQEAGLYRRSAATIINNTIRDCEGRFVKLQTNGSAVVQNNLMRNESAIELIENFVAVDSQVANATVINNKIYMGSTWTGGGSASIFASQAPLAANTQYAFEAFYQKFNANEVSCAKNMPYIVLPSFPADTTGTCYMEICDNTVTFDASLTTTNQSLAAASWFCYNGGAGWVAASSMTSQWVWTVARNRAQTFNFIGLPGVSGAFAGEDYTDKIFMYVYDNWKPPLGYSRDVVAGTAGSIIGGVTTSTVMVRDNMVGDYAGTWAMNTDLAKIFNGCDFYSSSQVNTNVPANYTFSRIARHGGMWIVHRASNGIYLSPDATTWTNIT
jgi:hypothetical protein